MALDPAGTAPGDHPTADLEVLAVRADLDQPLRTLLTDIGRHGSERFLPGIELEHGPRRGCDLGRSCSKWCHGD